MANIYDKVTNLYHEYLPFAHTLREQRRANLDSFLGKYVGKTRSKLAVPVTFAKIQSVIAKLVMQIIGQDEFFITNPERKSDRLNAISMHKLLNKQAHTRQFFLNFTMWVTYTLLHSLSMVRVYWHKQNRPYMIKRARVNDSGQFSGKYDKEIKNDFQMQEPRFSVCDMNRLLMNPNSPYLFPEEGRDLIEHYYKPVSYVLSQFENKNWNGTIAKKRMQETSKSLAYDWEGNYGWDQHLDSPFQTEYDPASDPVVLVTEYHTDKEWHVLINLLDTAHHEKRPEYLQYKPYVSLKDYYLPHDILGMSEAEIMAPMQTHLNTSRNIRIDNMNVIQNRMWIVDIMAEISREHLAKSTPGKVIYSSAGVEAVKGLETQDISQSAYREEQIARFDMDEATGTYSNVMGQTPEPRTPASSSMMASRQANAKFDLKAKTISRVGLSRLLEVYGDYNIEFGDAAQYVRRLGEDGKYLYDSISPEELPGIYSFDVIVAADEPQKEIRREQLMNWYRYAMSRSTINQDYLDLLIAKEFKLTQAEISKLIKLPPDEAAKMFDPEEENKVMRFGGRALVNDRDNDTEHMQSHLAYYQEMYNTMPGDRAMSFESHLLDHDRQMKQKQKANPGLMGGVPQLGGGGADVGGQQPTTRNIPYAGGQRSINPMEIMQG